MIIFKNSIQTKFNKTSFRGFAFLIWLFVFFLAFLPLVFGKEAGLENLNKGSDTYQKLKVFSEIISLLEENYVQNIDPDELIDGAIRGMLKTLDPHTTYMKPESYKEMRVETSGKFGGLGIEISIRDGVLTVITPIEDTPAY